MNTYLLRGLIALFALLQLVGCSAVSSLSEETFTFQGKLPKGFGMEAQAQYTRLDPNCAVSRRDLYREFTTEPLFSDAATEYRFEIPVFYRVSGCRVRLVNVGIYTYGKYGAADWQYDRDLGELRVISENRADLPRFDERGFFRKGAQCEWLFQISKLYLELSKLLKCQGDGSYLQVNELVGKTVVIDFSVSEIEKPAWDGYWKKLDKGWKPCTGRWGTKFEELCTEPPRFIPFKMEGRECVIYPGCIE